MIEIEGNYLVIKTDLEYDYDIQLKQLNTIEGLRKWLFHMQEKTWWDELKTNEMIKICNDLFGYHYAE